MKIALLLTGQLRTHDMCKHNIKTCLIDRYDTDVFMSIDTDNGQQNEWRNSPEQTQNHQVVEAVSWYKPISYIVTTEPDYSIADSLDSQLGGFVGVGRTRLLFIQYANVKKVYKLLQDYIKKTKTEYDVVIRLRFDEMLWNSDTTILHECLEKHEMNPSQFTMTMEIKYNDVNIEILKALSKRFTIDLDPGHPNTIYTHGSGLVHGYPIVNDYFWTHGPDLVDRIACFYDEMPELLLECSRTFFPNRGCLIEHLFFKFLFKYHIYIKTSVVKGIVIRELPFKSLDNTYRL